VASRWRIRHKLLLGLGTVVCLMALLLCGTLRGIWSAYLFTNTIKDRTNELVAAEKIDKTVTELLASTPELLENPNGIPVAVGKVRDAMSGYRDRLDETISRGRDPLHGVLEKEMLDDLEEKLQTLEEALGARAKPGVNSRSTDTGRQEDRNALKEPSKPVLQATLDICNKIKDDLDKRMGQSKRENYQLPLWTIVPSAVLGLIIMAGLMRAFYSWVLNPIRDLEAGVGRVAEGDFRNRIELHSGDEMEDLANAFNVMLDRLRELYDDLARQVNERSRQLVRSERLASVGFLAAGVAHEINNPLASIAFCGEALEARLGELTRHLRTSNRAVEEHDIFSKYLKMIQEEAFRCKTITERLLEFSRTGERKRDQTDLRGLVQSVLDVTQHLPNHRGKRITFEVPPERAGGRITAWVNGEEIKSVILNLVVNALESMDEDGRLTIRLGQRDGLAELRFSDTGCGMTREVLENIFEPFFTRSRSGKGTGLGLTISHLIISQHGGEIEASSPGPNQGSTFIVRLPTQPTEAVADLTIGEAQTTGPRPMTGQAA
jgi:signal transduction histidine kinase